MSNIQDYGRSGSVCSNTALVPYADSSSPLTDDAARAANLNTTTRRSYRSFVSNSNSPYARVLIDSSTWNSIYSPISSPAPTFSPLSSPRAVTFGSSFTFIDAHQNSKVDLADIQVNLVCNWLYQKQLQRMWCHGGVEEGVIVRKSREEYICCPGQLSNISSGLYDAVRHLNVKCAMTVSNRITELMLDMNDKHSIPLNNGLRLQVVPELFALPKCQKNQFAAFIRNPPMLVVWDDDPGHIVERIQDLEDQLMASMWKIQSAIGDGNQQSETVTEKSGAALASSVVEASQNQSRKTKLIQPAIVAATLFIMCISLGAGWRNIAIELKVQQTWACLAFLAVGPLQAWLGLFFMYTIPTCVAQIIGPVRQMKQNSKFYSGQPPPRIRGPDLPHVTIQCPVYKESLSTVIKPTIESIKAAISTYEMQGGTANIFINDDGMQALSNLQAQERKDFYEEHNVGWVARPKHNAYFGNSGQVFQRTGKFKKASNMNYGLNISVRVEDKLKKVARTEMWTVDEESEAYEKALTEVIDEDKGCTWAEGNIRVGDYILLIDSDTRVPRDCLLDAVSEMEQSPDVAILQFSSGVMNVTESWFEKGITFFTNLIYTAIEFAVANGDVAPFVGHNALLRWSAIQDVAYSRQDRSTYHQFWSEATVSEDFELSLRLQTSGYIVRLAAYTHGAFKEGVSLTVYDELARWEKYAYGCSELIFNPIVQWPWNGPFTPLFRNFIFSGVPFHGKVSIMAYIGTYFGIASSWVLTVLNYFLIGWYNGYLNHYYIESFKIYFSTIVVFNLVGNVALAVLRYRTHEKKLLPALFENFKWVLLLTTFLGGVSLHVSQAILCHLLSINMTWGSTSKEATSTTFFHEIPVILRKFRFTFTFCFGLTITMIVMSGVGPFACIVPYFWQINKFTAIVPLILMLASHALLPLALNPGLMQFTF